MKENNKKNKFKKNPINSLFEIEHFLQNLTQIKNSINIVKNSKKICKNNKSMGTKL